MSKRMTNGQFAKRRSPLVIAGSWLASFASIGIAYVTGRVLMGNLAGFRSCDSNSDGLKIVSCGKDGLNAGDFLILLLFILSAALVFALFTMSWRMTRRKPL